ncbi:glycosyltransferase family 4 protein [Flavobacterium sp. TSSA_36]|uniref:glycosyltransferase family 4 protein n=1 Tax=Flavobacterium sp. TSSA_36 TaxID=3447669 RepID=UPI003F40DD13
MLKKLKIIIFFIPHHHIGGAERVHLNIIKALHYKPIVFFDSSNTNTVSKEFSDNAYCFLITNAKRRKYAFRLLQVLTFLFPVTLFGCNSGTFYNFVSRLKRNIKAIDLTHAFSFPDYGMEISSLPFVNLLDKRIVINAKTYEDYKQLYSENNIDQYLLKRFTIIPNGIEIYDFDSSLINSRWNNFTVGFVGRNSSEKRPELFFEIIKKNRVKAKVIGDDFEKFKIEFSNVTYFENCNNKEEIREQFSDISLLIVSSRREGFPLVIMEAMELGIPVIATDVGSISEHVISYENGFLAPVEEKVFLEYTLGIINELKSNEELYFDISKNARNHAERNFSIGVFNSKYQQLFYE